MTEDELHPTDVAAMRDSASHGGPLRQELSNAIVALFKQYHGRGPADCRTYLEPDLVVVVMTGGYHAAEQTLFEAGKWSRFARRDCRGRTRCMPASSPRSKG